MVKKVTPKKKSAKRSTSGGAVDHSVPAKKVSGLIVRRSRDGRYIVDGQLANTLVTKKSKNAVRPVFVKPNKLSVKEIRELVQEMKIAS